LDDFFNANQKHSSPIHIFLMCTKSDEMKIILAFFALFSFAAISAQTSDSVKIKASDPTQLYTFVNVYGGLNFIEFNYGQAGWPEIDTWEFGFRGNWAIKKFRIGVYLPASNNSTENRVFDDIMIDAGYQLHNNSGFYNATVINAGFSSPTYDELFGNVYPNSSSFSKYFFNYVGALKLTNKLSFYPGIEWFKRTYGYYYTRYFYDRNSGVIDTIISGPSVTSMGWKFSGIFSYDFNARNFVQFYASWSTENWNAMYGSSENLNAYLSSIVEQRLHISGKYQYAFSPYSQIYLQLLYNGYSMPETTKNYPVEVSLYSFQLGYIFFLH
jgi:hypothetical protein